MSELNRRLVLAERPSGNVDESTIRVERDAIPEPGPGEALVRTRFISIDPTIRTWMDDAPGYLPPIGIGDVIRAGALAEVVSSNSDRYAEGDLVFGTTGWQDYAIADEGERAMRPVPPGTDPHAALSVFGLTGLTAYFGLIDVGRVKEGDVVVVSGAAGRNRVGGRPDRPDQGRLPGSSGSPAARRSAPGSSTSSASTRRSTIAARTCAPRSAPPAPTASISSSTTSAARSSTTASPGSRCTGGSCSAGRSPPTTRAPPRDQRTTEC